MKFIKNLFTGFKGYFQAASFIFKNDLKGYLLWPFLIFFLYFIGIGAIVASIAESIIDVLTGIVTAYVGADSWFSWVGTIGGWLVKIAVKTAMFFMMAYFSGFVILMMMGPILGRLAERVEEIETGRYYPSMKVQDFFLALWRGIVTNLRSMAWETLFIILVFFFTMIPVIGLIGPILLFVISAYFMGIGFMDGFDGRSIKESSQFARDHKGIAISNGTPFALVLMIPWLGTFFACFIAIFATVSATLNMVELKKEASE